MPPIIPRGVPFAQIPHDLICDPQLSHTAVRVYCYLVRRANDEARAWPGVRRIAEETGMGRNTARRGIDALEAAGWIMVEREYDTETQRHEVNRYTVLGERGVGSEWTQGGSDSTPGGGSVVVPELHPVLTTSNELEVAATPRTANPWWDATVEIFGTPTDGQRTLYGRFVAMVKDWPPSEIATRATQLASLWGHKTVTVASLEKHWSRFDAAIGQVTDDQVDEFAAAQRRAAGIARLTNE